MSRNQACMRKRGVCLLTWCILFPVSYCCLADEVGRRGGGHLFAFLTRVILSELNQRLGGERNLELAGIEALVGKGNAPRPRVSISGQVCSRALSKL